MLGTDGVLVGVPVVIGRGFAVAVSVVGVTDGSVIEGEVRAAGIKVVAEGFGLVGAL